jgi:PleD family two-component response regulator
MDLVGMVYASFGVTLIRADDDVSDTIARADTALYRAKNVGRNRVEFEP